MASSSQRLETIIAINAQVGNGFADIGSTLTQLGAITDGLSSKLIEFGEESISVYRNYEKSMKDAEVALSTTYGRSTKELASVMSSLDDTATEWAASSIFHTNDVANAISEAAHAGWDYDQILNGIPAAMQLAQAGGLDLSEAVNYIVKATTAAGVSFDDLTHFTDLWAFAANSSASTIGEFGEAMLRMGNTMRFVSDPEELMTLIAVTANAGTVGSEAGTMIRNSIMRLIAPTDKATKAMAELGATSDEASVLMNDQALAAANARLEAEGFSAYDANGELKPVLDTYRELYLSLGDIAGGFDNIEKNSDALQILSAIFPTRTITEALTLLRSAAEGYDGLYDSMKSGEAEGYGAYAAETMMDTLDGKIETFLSKAERLKQLVGEELSGQPENGLEGLGDIIDNIAGMDDASFSALVSGLEVIAAAGPGMMIAGSAFRLIGNLLTPTGAVAAGLVTLTTLAATIKDIQDSNFADAFGTMEIDDAQVSSYLSGITEEFQSAYKEVDSFREALDKSIESYKNASESFSSKLFTDMLTDATLSDADIAELESLAEQMGDTVIEGIQNSTAASMSFWEMLFGGADKAPLNEDYRDITDFLGSSYDDSIAQMQEVSQQLRDALTSAFEDGKISEEEYQNILSYIKSYNEAVAQAELEAKNEQDQIEYQKLLDKAQVASLDEIKDVQKEIDEAKNTALKEAEETFLTDKASFEVQTQKALENGGYYESSNGEKVKVTQQWIDEKTAAMESEYRQHILEIDEKYDRANYALWDTNARQGEYGEAYKNLETLAEQVMKGEVTAESAVALFKDAYGNNANAGEWDPLHNSDRTGVSDILAYMISGMGGYDTMASKIADYEAKGDYGNADILKTLYTMQQIVDNFATTDVLHNEGLAALIAGEDNVISSANDHGFGHEYQAQKEAFENTINPSIPNYSLNAAYETVKTFGEGKDSIKAFFNSIGDFSNGTISDSEFRNSALQISEAAANDLNKMVSELSQLYDFEQIRQDTGNGSPLASEDNAYKDYFALNSLMYGEASLNPEQYRITVTPEVDESELQNLDPITIRAHVESEDSMAALQEQGVQVDVDGNTQQLEATIDGADGQTLLEYVNGDAEQLEMSITDQDGKTLEEKVTGDPSQLAAIINSYNGKTITVNIQGRKMFASGGRATSASIFGEAGPEWAIPEEHSERTAQLLNAAREASGFTWPELLGQYGGLRSGNSEPTTLVYSPTIYAENAAGVEQALQADKERLNKWFKSKKIRDEVEEYA